jgi:hypothetical protein
MKIAFSSLELDGDGSLLSVLSFKIGAWILSSWVDFFFDISFVLLQTFQIRQRKLQKCNEVK